MEVSGPLGGADEPGAGPSLGEVLSSRPRAGHLRLCKSSGLFLGQGATRSSLVIEDVGRDISTGLRSECLCSE